LKELEHTSKEEKKQFLTPLVNGYKILKDPEPQTVSSDLHLFTWGELASTPNILKNENHYQLQQTPQREIIAHNLSNISVQKKIEKEARYFILKNSKKQNSLIQNTGSLKRRNINLTPSGMKLLNSVRRGKLFCKIDHPISINSFDRNFNIVNTPINVEKNFSSGKRNLSSISVKSTVHVKKK
jgi:hypothetical protein